MTSRESLEQLGVASYSIGFAFDGAGWPGSLEDAVELEEDMSAEDYVKLAFDLACEKLDSWVRFYDADGNEIEVQV